MASRLRNTGSPRQTAPAASRSRPRRSRSSPEPPTSEAIALIAFELFQQRGGNHGQDQEDWFEAERIAWERCRQTDRRTSERSHRRTSRNASRIA